MPRSPGSGACGEALVNLHVLCGAITARVHTAFGIVRNGQDFCRVCLSSGQGSDRGRGSGSSCCWESHQHVYCVESVKFLQITRIPGGVGKVHMIYRQSMKKFASSDMDMVANA